MIQMLECTAVNAGGCTSQDIPNKRERHMLDAKTIQAGLAGSEEELAAILDMVRQSALSFSRHRLCDKLRGRVGDEDVAQEAQLEFSKAQKRGIEFLSVTQFGAFVNAITKRALFQVVRREINRTRGAEWNQVVADGSKELLNDMIGAQGTPSEEVLAVERSNAIQDAIGQLDEKQRLTVELFYFQELTSTEIATLLEEKPSAINSRLFRSRKLLFSFLQTQGYLSERHFQSIVSPKH